MKWILVMIATLAVGHSVWASERCHERKWYGDIQHNLLIIPGNGDVSFMPHIGVEYRYHDLFSPKVHIGCSLRDKVNFVTVKAQVKSKLKANKPFYVSNGIHIFYDHKGPCNEKVFILPAVAAGVEMDGNKFYEVGFLLSSGLLRNAAFTLNTGIQF